MTAKAVFFCIKEVKTSVFNSLLATTKNILKSIRKNNMPELPEVETIKRQLLKEVIGKKIKEVELRLPGLVYFDGRKGDAKNFKKNLEGSKIVKADRAAKILILTLSNGYTLLIHLKMTGQLIYRAKNGNLKMGGHPWPPATVEVPNKWTHIIFHFTDGSK